MHIRPCLLPSLIATAAGALAGGAAAHADTVLVTADRMIDVLQARVLEHPRITITDDRITAVDTGAASSTVPAAGVREVDLPGMTLLPTVIEGQWPRGDSRHGAQAAQVRRRGHQVLWHRRRVF